MTKARPANPQPTSGTNYDSYLWPRSKTPAKQAIYDELHERGWRVDARTALWFTPEADTLQGFGILECASDFSWWRIQPPSEVIEGVPHRPPPLLFVGLKPGTYST